MNVILKQSINPSKINWGDFIIDSEGTVYLIIQTFDSNYAIVNVSENYLCGYEEETIEDLINAFLKYNDLSFRVIKQEDMNLVEV